MRLPIAYAFAFLGCSHSGHALTTAAPMPARNADAAPSMMDLEASATPRYSPPASESTTLTVRLINSQNDGQATVGWFLEDGTAFGLLDSRGVAGVPSWWGEVPSKRIRVLAQSREAGEKLEVEGKVDLADGREQTIDLNLSEQRHGYTREIAVSDARRNLIADLPLSFSLDGSIEAARDALLNNGHLVTNENGRVSIRLHDRRKVRLTAELPLANKLVSFALSPDQSHVAIQDVVSCFFRCEDGSKAPHLGYLAVAKLKDGTEVRHELPAEDSFRFGTEVLAWPAGATSVVVSSNGFSPARLSSASRSCHLVQRSDRGCGTKSVGR